MIRLNDINKTVIDEKKTNMYMGRQYTNYDTDTPTFENKYELYISNERIGITIQYATKEARDKDIELLDKLFDVKNIEDKAYAYPHEIDALKFAMSGIKKASEPAKEEYLTWKEVESGKSLTTYTKALLNGKTVFVRWNDLGIRLYDEEDGLITAAFYSADLFNALRLKKVE